MGHNDVFVILLLFEVVGHNDVFVRLLFFQVVGRDGSEISGEAREEVMAMGKEAFVQVKTRTKSFCFLFTTFYFSSQKLFGRPL